MASELDLGGSWAPFGKDLGRSGRPFGHFCGLFGRLLGVLNQPFFKHRSKIGSKRPFGANLDRFWRVLGGFGVDFGRVWARFWKIFQLFKKSWADFGHL